MGELVKEIQNVTQEVLENKKGSWKDQLPFLCVRLAAHVANG